MRSRLSPTILLSTCASFAAAAALSACAGYANDSAAPPAAYPPPPIAAAHARRSREAAPCQELPRAAFPASFCAAIRAKDPSAADGEYLLPIAAPGGDPVFVYCHAMALKPTEYLTLRAVGEGRNASTYGQGPNSNGLRTQFTKVRFYPHAMTLDPSDTTFAISDGSKSFGKDTFHANDYGSAGDCRGDRSTTGTANIDLSGTRLTVARAQFSPDGFNPAGETTYRANDQIVDLTGGGYCGDNKATGGRIALGFLDPEVPTSTATPRASAPPRATVAASALQDGTASSVSAAANPKNTFACDGVRCRLGREYCLHPGAPGIPGAASLPARCEPLAPRCQGGRDPCACIGQGFQCRADHAGMFVQEPAYP